MEVSYCSAGDWCGWLPPLILAPFVGSFLGVLICRLPSGRPVGFARSVCDHCGHTLAPWELLPIVSFVVQRGRCRRCGGRIAPLHLAIELAAFGVAVWAVLALPDIGNIWFGCILGWALLVLSWIDWRHMILPDVLTLPLLITGLAATWFLEPEALLDHLLAAVLGYLTFRGLEIAYRRLRGREGLGQGDAKLLAAAGAWVGLLALPFVIFAAAVAGLCLALYQRLRGRLVGGSVPLPFGPALALALWLVWLYGPI